MAVSGCGGSDAQCLIDTDCPLFQRCAQSACVPVDLPGGPITRRDAGLDDGGQREDTGAPESRAGTIVATNSAVGPSYTLSATFRRTDPGCDVADSGPCVATRCPESAVTMVPEAGMISVEGSSVTPSPSIAPDANGFYSPAMGAMLLWDPDPGAARSEVSLQATGGDRGPAGFEPSPFTLTMTGPEQVTLSAPDFAAPFSRSGVTFMWSPAASSPVVVTLSSTAGGFTTTAVCSYSGNSGTVPNEVLAALTGAMATVSVVTRSTDASTTNGFEVEGMAQTLAVTSDGMTASGQVTLQ